MGSSPQGEMIQNVLGHLFDVRISEFDCPISLPATHKTRRWFTKPLRTDVINEAVNSLRGSNCFIAANNTVSFLFDSDASALTLHYKHTSQAVSIQPIVHDTLNKNTGNLSKARTITPPLNGGGEGLEFESCSYFDSLSKKTR